MYSKKAFAPFQDRGIAGFERTFAQIQRSCQNFFNAQQNRKPIGLQTG